MKKSLPWVIAVVIIAAGGGVLWTHRHKNNPGTGNMPASSSSNSSSGASQATNKVTIANFDFSPASITIRKGTTVTWTNTDTVAHTVTETDGKTGPGSQDIAKGQSYSFTYNTTGTFKYHCSIHPEMTGTVTVTE